MDGKTWLAAAWPALENVRHAAAVARRVMEKTPHLLLVGEGAKLFAVQQGFPLETLLTPESVAAVGEEAAQAASAGDAAGRAAGQPRHRDGAGPGQNGVAGRRLHHLGAGAQAPGRVGDSPLIGAGLYVDDAAGAAGGTGVGEEIIRIAGSHLIVEAMRAGQSPQEACELAVRRVNAVAARRGVHPAQVAFIASGPEGARRRGLHGDDRFSVRRRPAGRGGVA